MYYTVEYTSTIHIGVEAENKEDAIRQADYVIDDMEVQDEFSSNANCEGATEIDEGEYDCLTLKADEL